MSDRIKGCMVVFEKDMHEEDAERVLDTIRGVRCVGAVEASVADPTDWMARERVRMEFREKLMNLILGREPDAKT